MGPVTQKLSCLKGLEGGGMWSVSGVEASQKEQLNVVRASHRGHDAKESLLICCSEKPGLGC
jgi:hypothetical protein